MREELTAKDLAIYKANEIKQLCGDLKYAQNKDLKIFGIEKISYLADGILERLEYLDVKSKDVEGE